MRLRRTRPSDAGEPILPLIDVVFFLLVFFMLVGRMDATAPFHVTPPIGQSGTDLPAGGLILTISREGAVAIDGTETPSATVAAELERRHLEDPGRPIRINADAGAEVRHVLRLLSLAEALGAADISIVITPGVP